MTSNPSPVYNGRYELRSQIARGGTAQVYLARDLLLDRPVALKVLFPELSADHAFVERFRREAQAAANLSHPNIVPVFDWGESDRTHFIVMEYVDGEALSAVIRSEAPLPAARAASVAADIAKALSYAHRHGVVHRDVKPGNVLLTADGLVKVTDFGIARAMGVDEQVTQTGLVMGTATYFSPEQAQGLGVDGRSDVYALGVVLYEMLAGRPPFVGESPVAIAYQHVREEPPPLRSFNPDVPAALEAVVEKAMAKAPAERYASADDLRLDLERFLRGQTVLARAAAVGSGTGPVTTVLPRGGTGTVDLLDTSIVEPVAPERSPRARRTTPWWALAAVVLLAAIGVVVYFGGRGLGYFGGRQYVHVPDVRGLSVSKAEKELRQHDLRPHLAYVKGSQNQNGHIAAQSVAFNNTVRTGTTVGLSVWRYTPPATATVPNVSNQGIDYPAAVADLKAAGFSNVSPHYLPATSGQQQQDAVVGQSVAAGTTQPRTATITLDVIKGTSFVTIPQAIVGESVAAATNALQAAGLKVGGTTQRLSAQYPANEVIATSPAQPGQQVPPHSTLTLIVSSGGVAVSDVSGDNVSAAETALQQQGFTSFTTQSTTSSQFPAGAVVKTFPAAGSIVHTDRTIVLFVVGPTTPSTSGTSGTSPGTSGTSGTSPGTSGSSGSSGTSGTTTTSGTSGTSGTTASGPSGPTSPSQTAPGQTAPGHSNGHGNGHGAGKGG